MRPSRSSRHSPRHILVSIFRNELGLGESGQMSVFLALVFQVLFVFFAMVINVGLLVHDKINLQNSVDLGAYYAAQRQAEILNEIAHLNYQIRQDYKLLAWRYWVLGTLGRDAQGNQKPAGRGGNAADAPSVYSVSGIEEVPVACLANPYWWEFAILRNGSTPNENYCWNPYGWTSTAIPVPSVPATPATFIANYFVQLSAQQSRSDFTMSCNAAAPLSWAFVASILTDYKYSVAYKKKAIRKLRENLVSATPTDRDGRAIRDGVIETIKKNLTESNRQSFDPTSVQMLNGLTKGGCDGGGVYPGAKTLPEILTAPGLYFALLAGTGGTCSFNLGFQIDHARVAAPGVGVWDPTGELRNRVSGEPGPDDEFHSTLGFEKNPWCMAYMGVKASTSPRKPFAPFGKAVNLVARAFAQPFGGRIGPWYAKRWNRSESQSELIAQPTAAVSSSSAPAMLNPAPGQENRTDPLTSPRLTPGSGGSYVYSSYSIPNFSRFPGDRLGFRSKLGQAMARSFFLTTNAAQGANGTAPGNFSDNRVRLNWLYGFSSMNTTGDTLAFDDPALTSTGSMPLSLGRFRALEMAAVAPDLFDITYYSIDPAADVNYTELARANPSRYGIPGVPVGDLGSRQNIIDLRKSNVESQVDAVNGTSLDAGLRPAIYWLIRDWRHLLTGWGSNTVTNFAFPSARFGQCLPGHEALPTAMIPGKCAAGGRTGYSVRIIAREHLNGPWQVGGDGVAPGAILNPPGDDSEF